MQIQSLTKVYSDGQHNAFTGLAAFGGTFHLAFRNAPTHGAQGGRQMMMRSPDAKNWTLAATTVFPTPPDLPPGTPMDLRDNYFLNVGSELRLYSFVLPPLGPDGEYMRPPGSVVQCTTDGVTWSEPKEIHAGSVLWKPIYWNGTFWCAGYRRVRGEGLVVEFFSSDDGLAWRFVCRIAPGNEAVLDPVDSDRLRVYIRNQDAPRHLEIWEAKAPFDTWTKAGSIAKIIESPHVVRVDDTVFLCGREVPTGDERRSPHLRRSKIWEINGLNAREVLELPSLGDTSYFGTVVCPDGTILASYYSQHEHEMESPVETRGGNDKPADIFIARLTPSAGF